jgi:hypothetical protein
MWKVWNFERIHCSVEKLRRLGPWILIDWSGLNPNWHGNHLKWWGFGWEWFFQPLLRLFGTTDIILIAFFNSELPILLHMALSSKFATRLCGPIAVNNHSSLPVVSLSLINSSSSTAQATTLSLAPLLRRREPCTCAPCYLWLDCLQHLF